jgi:hypothetical protein
MTEVSHYNLTAHFRNRFSIVFFFTCHGNALNYLSVIIPTQSVAPQAEWYLAICVIKLSHALPVRPGA